MRMRKDGWRGKGKIKNDRGECPPRYLENFLRPCYSDCQFIMISGKDRELLKEFGQNLKKVRESRGLSLRDLSYRCKIDFSDIGKMERGETNMTLLTILALADALEVPSATLFNY